VIRRPIARALTIGGSDPTGGAGIQQDLRTFSTLGVWGLSAITAVTVQSTTGVSAVAGIDPETVEAQIGAVAVDLGVDAAKTGMLGSADVVCAVARAVRDNGIAQLVVDPVMAATSGGTLLAEDAVQALVAELLPLAMLVTPNAGEAERLTGVSVDSISSQIEAAVALRARSATAVLVKGGHVGGARPVDVLVDANGEVHEFTGVWVDTPNTHGTGCVLSAAIVAGLATGLGLVASVGRAKGVVTRALEHSLGLGAGPGPVCPVPEVPEGGSWPFAGHPFE